MTLTENSAMRFWILMFVQPVRHFEAERGFREMNRLPPRLKRDEAAAFFLHIAEWIPAVRNAPQQLKYHIHAADIRPEPGLRRTLDIHRVMNTGTLDKIALRPKE